MKGILGILTLAVAGQAVAADQICNLAVQVCPKTLEGATINVPEDVIWLEPKLPFCPEQVQVQTGATSPPPSIVFIIDNSGSMSDNSGSGNDPDEARFTVVRDLLDTIYRASPDAEVGLAIFSRRLQFDVRDNPTFLKSAFPDDTTMGFDAYVPLTRLNQAVGSVRGVDTLKAMLKYTGNGYLTYATTRPSTRVNNSIAADNVRDGTDITLGFDAAKEAMKASKADPANRYFIFLSDGEPTALDVIRQARRDAFQQGAATPTTFTVFFKAGNNPTVPNTIRTMTENIRANGYSTSNPKSNYWAINLPGTQLMSLLQSNVLNPILANRAATAASATLVSGTTTLTSSGQQDSSFLFPSRVPLAPTQTSVQLTYNYTYMDSGKTKTHQATYTLNIRRTAAGTPPPGVTTICKDPGDIILTHKGTPVNIVTADHENLDVKLVLPGGEVCANCQVTVQPHANRAGKDNQAVEVRPAGGTSYTGSFGRETSTASVANDGKLQHLPTDSIVVTWVNPQNPLDVIRKAFPYRDVRTALVVENHNTYSKADNTIPMVKGKQWILAGSNNVKITTSGGSGDCCVVVPTLPSEDSVKYVGIKVTASRSFRVEIQVYDNLGQYVNKVGFEVPQAEFNNLPRVGTTGNNRSLSVLWDSRTEDGSFAGTGAYIFKTTVTLLRVPGIAEDQVAETDHRLVGVVSGKK